MAGTVRTCLVLFAVLCLAPGNAYAQDPTLDLRGATLIRAGDPVPLAPAANRFGPGSDSVDIPGTKPFRSQLQFRCAGIPEGRYTVGLPLLSTSYAGFAEFLAGRVHLYHNDTRLLWTSHTEPVLPENAGEKRLYQAELRCNAPTSLKPADILRVMYPFDHGAVTVGAIRLYARPPSGPTFAVGPQDWGKPVSVWLQARWEDARRGGDLIHQPCVFYNPGVLPRTFTFQATATDALQNPLLGQRQTLTLTPGEKATQVFQFRARTNGRTRLTVTCTAKGVTPPVRLVRFWVDDRTEGPRPDTCLNGLWEMCFVAGAEPGEGPPAGAAWKPVNVPSLQPNKDGHCAWYRKTFAAPAHVRGERVLLRCGQVMSEAWFVLNGRPVAHQRHGSQPFEVDLTEAFRPGERNELLVGIRDWLAYSPKNRERVARGEAPIYKDNMVDVAGYAAAAQLGIGGSVWLEARPAVSVDDVFVVTSVREKKLTLQYRLANTGATDQQVALSPQILDAGRVAKTLAPVRVRVPAGGTATLTVAAPWPDAKFWWPDTPHLYVLRTDLKPAAGAADRHDQRFGFREMWLDGTAFVLNGTRVKIRSAWASGASGTGRAAEYWQPEKRLEAIWEWQTHCVQNTDHQLTRTHLSAGVEDACDLADETGLMIKLESEVGQVSFTFDQAFWNAAVQHELHVMDVYKNHPSVVMWSAGNENMWGWIYQGEAAKVMGNRWQVKIVRAMRAFDLMRRPIEWEADGDLMGKWEHHALHYPRELNSFPDVPNSAWWGPLDKKTVVPYSMGPITLGEKPLTVGEAFWPATLAHPYGETILLGDDAYLGGHAWAKAWVESSRFFINGFRDVEFALVDVYTPLSLLKPQTVVLKQEERAFFGGRRLRREVNVHNDLRRPALLTLRWRLERQGTAEGSPREPAAPATPATAAAGPLPRAAAGAPSRAGRPFQVASSGGGTGPNRQIGPIRPIRPIAQSRAQAEAPSRNTQHATRAPLASGELPLRMAPAELKRLALDVPLPAVAGRTDCTFRVELYEGANRVHVETRAWQIHPPAALRVPADLNLAVYDPLGQTTALLRRLKVPFTPVKEMSAGTLSGALLIGKDALKQPPEGPWREAVGAFVREGGKVLLLEQSEAPDFLPVPLTQAGKRPTTIAFRRAADHPALAGLEDDDLRWWADGHVVSAGNYRKPIRGNALPLVDAGTMDGVVETPLIEEYDGKGSYLLCQMLLTGKAAQAPQAARLLQNLLEYLASPRSFRTPGATALLARPDSPLRKALDESRLVCTDLSAQPDGSDGLERLTPDNFAVAIVDLAGGLQPETAAALKAFAAAGGRVLLHRARPEHATALEALLGVRLRFLPVAQQPQDIQYHALRRSNEGLMAGISNHEFFWASSACFAELRHEGCWWSYYNCPPQEFIADAFVAPADDAGERAQLLTRPGTLLQVPAGKGYFLLSQLRLDEPVADVAVTASRLRALLLTNLGCTLRGEGGAAVARKRRLQQYEYFPVDLAPYANRGIMDNKAAGIVGWTNQGENDMRALPTGRQTLAGIPFLFASPRTAIVLHSTMANNLDLPKEVRGIKVGRRADVLFFLHTAAWTGEKPFRYRVNYDDGTSVEIPILNGQHVLDWWADPERYAEAMAKHGLFVAWRGDNPMRKGVLLPGCEWVNPHPDKGIQDIDFLTVLESGYNPVPVLAAITCAVNRSPEGVVTDVLGTHGIKVRLGTQEQEVHYIGVAGIPRDHPYYTKAVDAHRALVVGQKVTIQRDVVTQDAEGRELAYVYLGRDTYDVRNLANAKIIGDGLGKLGNFAGNNRQRMYLDNLGFIAQQRKAGMWAGTAK